MATFQKIQDAYFIYSCLDKNIILLKQFSNVSAPTLKKYITIYGRIKPRYYTKVPMVVQKSLGRAIKNARYMALIPFTR